MCVYMVDWCEALASGSGAGVGVVEVALYNGTNADDLSDPTRLGLLSAAHHRVNSPICQLAKPRVRELARAAGLSNWNLAAAPCLRSRLAAGVPAGPYTLVHFPVVYRCTYPHPAHSAPVHTRMASPSSTFHALHGPLGNPPPARGCQGPTGPDIRPLYISPPAES